MPKLDLDQMNVSVVDMTVAGARSLLDNLDETETDELELISELDKAQGMVHGQTTEVAYVVIKITP